LPSALATVDVPRLLSPSALGAAGGCVLRVVAASPGVHVERMPNGPEASVGILVHRVLEHWARGQGADDPLELFDAEYAEMRAALEQDAARRHFADLISTKGAQAWARLRAGVADRCRRVERRKAAAWVGQVIPGDVPLGPERPLSSDDLRLSGKADRIRKIGSHAYEVRDFKSGAVLDDAGEVKVAIQLQLRAYGLMVIDLDPEATVRLVVDDGDERDIPFDVAAQARAREEILTIIERVPPPGAVDARRLATPGVGCFGCSIRHVCAAYREEAPTWWRSYPVDVERVPDDIWGTVIEVIPQPNASNDILLTDAAGRRVRVDAMDIRHGARGFPAGSRVWLFGLQATGRSRGYDGKRFHPRVFHELPRDALERRAWSALVLVEATGPAVAGEIPGVRQRTVIGHEPGPS
jgi:hypothetical protein